MAQDVPLPSQETESNILVPPRPNLGPEPLPEPGVAISIVLYIAPAVVLAAIGGWRFTRRRVSRKDSQSRLVKLGEKTNDPETLPSARLLALAERARTVLIARFGEPWRAKTTEEIASDSRFSATFETNAAATLLDLLRRADVEKFSEHRESGNQGDLAGLLESWEALLRDVFEAGASSTINGK